MYPPKDLLQHTDCLHDANAINTALDRVAAEITQTLADSNPVVLCVMIGGLITGGHLSTRLHFPLQMDFVQLSSYKDNLTPGKLHWVVEPKLSLTDRTVLIVDDIFDSGVTINAIREYCLQKGAKAVYTAVMVSKQRERDCPLESYPQFIGVHTPDRYVFGFGLDYQGYWRNAPGIYAMKENGT
jgi:hypoxanthine phosphoribosyltransferase